MSSKGDFIISSWNIAGSLQDYSQINPEVKEILEQNFTSQAEADTAVAQASQIRDNVESIAANRLKESADVFCLQEVGQAVTNNETNDRIIISTLENANYTICRAGKNSDAALAISKEKFKDIENRSQILPQSNVDCAIAVATEKETGKKFAFVSVHVSGFALRKPDNPDQILDTNQQARIKNEEAITGDDQIRELIPILQHLENECDGVVIGGDFNVIHDRHPETYDRLSDLENSGYTIRKSKGPTSKAAHGFAIRESGPENRELDYFAVKMQRPKKKGFLNKLRNKFSKKPSVTHGEKPEKIKDDIFDPAFDHTQNPSDHRPIYMQIKIETASSKTLSDYGKSMLKGASNFLHKFKRH